MSRQKTAISTRDIIIFITTVIAIITAVIKFIGEVNRLSLWKEFFIATAVLAASNYIAFNIGNGDIFLVTLIITLITYCIFWNYKFSYKTTRLNASLWKERQWWWTLDGWQFEQEVANVFRINGYNAKVTKGSGDGGVDIILKKDGRTSIVQCKHYQNPVPPEPIRALWGCKDDFGADEVILVASSGITDMGARFVQNKPNFKVLNLDDIILMGSNTQQSELNLNSQQETTISKKQYEKTGRKIDI